MSKVGTRESSDVSKTTAPSSSGRISNVALVSGIFGSLVLLLLIIFTNPARELTGFYLLALVVTSLIAGIPIGIGMIAAGVLGVWKFAGINGMSSMLGTSVFGAAASWSYSVIPLFILMGIVLSRTGVTSKAFNTAKQWFGGLPGGLAVATNFSGAGLAAASGSSIGITHAVGRMAIPEMLRAGYKGSMATATVAVVGTLGQMIPPSILLVIYAGVAQTAVGPQLLAGIVPGALLAVAFAIYIVIRSRFSSDFAASVENDEYTWKTRIKSLVDIFPLLIVVFIVIGGIYTGWLTATEAGAFGAIAAIVVGALGMLKHGGLKAYFKGLGNAFVESALATGSIFLLIMGVMVLTRALALSQLPSSLAGFIVDMEFNRITLILVLVVLYMILGMFLDPLAMMLLTVPVLMEPLLALDINMVWFGIFLIIMAEIGQVSPPIGMLSFVVHKLTQDPTVNVGHKITLWDVFRGVLPFIGVALAVLALLVAFPDIVIWLPDLSFAE